MHEIELTGLDGSNLLAFLAALGTLRVLTLAEPDAVVRMSWRDRGYWMPVVHHSRLDSPKTLVDALAVQVCGEHTINSACRIGPNLTFTAEVYANFLYDAWEQADREQLAFLAAFGSEFIREKERMTDTAFRTMSGAGHQHFLATMVELARETRKSHLDSSLFVRWQYVDDRPNLRWDPADYRPHALRAENPSDDPIRTMRGANRLAIEALPFFPTFPWRRQLRTVAFEDRPGGVTLTWPIWDAPADAFSIAALLAQKPEPAVARGVVQLFQAQRFTDGKFRNFSPARALF